VVQQINVRYRRELGDWEVRGGCSVVEGGFLFELPVLGDGDALERHFERGVEGKVIAIWDVKN
jgi:hypothetical protein